MNLNEEQGKQIFWQRTALKLKKKKLADEDKELKEKLKLKKEGKAKKAATKVTKANTKKTLSDKLKTATRALADKREKRVLCTWCKVIRRISYRGRRRQLLPYTERACPVL